MINFVGIGGRLGHGKDAMADLLVKKYGFVKMGMSDPLADALYALNPFLGAEQDDTRYQSVVDDVGYTKAKEIPEVRRLLQVLGTEVGRRMISADVWVDIMVRRALAITENGGRVIVTGIRYPNELSAIQENGGESWFIKRPGLEDAGAAAAHSSETSLSEYDFDVIIMNDGTLAELEGIAEHIAKSRGWEKR